MFTGIRNIDSFAHDFLQSKEQRLYAAALVGRGIVNSIVKLSKNALHLFRDRQSKVSRILQKGYALIGFLMVNFSRQNPLVARLFGGLSNPIEFEGFLTGRTLFAKLEHGEHGKTARNRIWGNIQKALNLRISPLVESFFSYLT